jgi:hypothetical protein
MPGPQPPNVLLSEAERQDLHTLIRAHKTPQHYSFRAQIILLLAEGLNAPTVARHLGTTRQTGPNPTLIAAPGKCEVKRHGPRATTTTPCLFPHTVILPQTSRELLHVTNRHVTLRGNSAKVTL